MNCRAGSKPILPLITRAVVVAALVLVPAAQKVLADGDPSLPVATVNGVPIYDSDLDCAVEASLARMIFSSIDRGRDSRSAGSVAARSLNRLINMEILYQESLKMHFPGLSEKVEETYRREMERLGGEAGFRTALQCNDLTPEQFKQTIFRNLSINSYLNKVVYSRVTISEDEIKAYYQGHLKAFTRPSAARVRQIFIRIPDYTERAQQESGRRARSIHIQAMQGMDFSSLARRFSDDSAGAVSGGDMGVIYKGNLSLDLDTVIFSLLPGKVSHPVRTRSGFHIFKVQSITPPQPIPLEEVRDRIVESIRKNKVGVAVKALLEELRSRADIVVNLD